MARLPRLVLPGQAHLVVQRALPGVTAFVDDADVQAWRHALQEGLALQAVQLHAWSLSPQAVRLVLTPPGPAALGRLIQHLGRHYVAAYRRRHGGLGTLWDGRYRCAALEPGPVVLDAMRWVEAGSDAARSSAPHHLGLATDRLLSDPPPFWALGNTPFERENAWQHLLETGLPPAQAWPLEQALRGGWAVGGAAFAASAAATAGRPAVPRARGRPRRPVPPAD